MSAMISVPKPAPCAWKATVGAGLLIVAHAALSLVQYKHALKKIGNSELQALPTDICVEVVVGFLLTLVGVLKVAGDFRPAKAELAATKVDFDLNQSRPSFSVFNHRGRRIAERKGR